MDIDITYSKKGFLGKRNLQLSFQDKIKMKPVFIILNAIIYALQWFQDCNYGDQRSSLKLAVNKKLLGSSKVEVSFFGELV